MKNNFEYLSYVEGWLDEKALLFTSFYRTMFLGDTRFNSLEIGVHHGKYFIGLENITPPGSKAIAVDIFDSQTMNVDKSGKGNLAIFRANVDKYCLGPKRVTALSMDSLDIDSYKLGCKEFGILSIDGGHTSNHTMCDLQTCDKLANHDGLLVLDDILNANWLGVVTGAVQHFSQSSGIRFVPFAIGFNKLFCCHFTSKKLVIEKITNSQKELKELGIQTNKWLTDFAGHEVLPMKAIAKYIN